MIPVLIFISVFSCCLGIFFAVTAVYLSPSGGLNRRLERLAIEAQEAAAMEKPRELLRDVGAVEQAVFKLPLLKGVKRLIEHSGVRVKPLAFVSYVTGAAGLTMAGSYFIKNNFFSAAVVGLVVAYLPFIYLNGCKKSREKKFSEQLPDALIMIARSLRAGHSLASAVELVGQELQQPTGGIFKTAFEQQRLGIRMPEALSAMQEWIDSMDLHFFVTIVKINSEAGGSLAEVLDKLAETIRSRIQIRRQVQTYTAEGRMSGIVLLIMPFVVFVAFYLKNPDYMKPFFTERSCQMSLVAAAVAQVVGFLMIRKIVDIRI